jgi:DNA-binding NarL/FixJ family response regulator
MRVLIAQPHAMLGEGIARVVRGVAPRADVVTRGKADLLADTGADAEVPPRSLSPIRGFRWRRCADAQGLACGALIVITRRAEASTERRLLADHVAALIPDSVPSDLLAAGLRVALAAKSRCRARICCLHLQPGILKQRDTLGTST